MTYQVLARKWRPKRFSEMIGQTHVIRALCNALDSNRLHHAYLFTGTRGVGKTTIARLFAKSINCENGVSSTPCGECSVCREVDEGRCMDLIEVDAASRTGVDETRDLMENVQYTPARARYKVYLIDEVHMFSKHSFNALLKTLEEPPPHVKFLLATTDPKRMPVTVLSRCLQFNLSRIPASEIQRQLARILDAEGFQYDEAALRAIAQAADGSDRDALSLLDQAIAFTGGVLGGDAVLTMLGSVRGADIHALMVALADGNGPELIAIARRLAEFDPDFASVLGEMLSYLQRIAVCQVLGADADTIEADAAVKELAARISPPDCQLYYQIAAIGRRDLPLAPDPQVGFEMILLRLLAFRPAVPSAPVSAPTRTERTAVAGSPVANTGARSPEARQSAPPSAADWPRLLESLALTGLARELAKNCAWQSFDGKQLVLAVDPQFERLRNKVAEPRLIEALRARFGSDLQVTIKAAAEAATDSPSARNAAAERERQRKAEEVIEHDELIQALKKNFDASVEDVSAR